jgi:hypothetical protein
MLDRINTLMAGGALPFAALLLLDALTAGGVNHTLVSVLEWTAKGALALVAVLLAFAIARKWRARGPASEEDSYSSAMLRRAVAVSWVATFVVLTQFDSLFEGAGVLGMVELPLVHAGGIVTAFMLVVLSLTYFGSMMLASGQRDALEERP